MRESWRFVASADAANARVRGRGVEIHKFKIQNSKIPDSKFQIKDKDIEI
jgi:hypothetical protein